ncbi:MAG: hypothetical protein JJ992_16160, partial [Planctomycetes bacterium]|nr:hypothetical protein [Planctomycetota bacterium]
MLGKLLPLLFLLSGGGLGMGAAVFLMPQPDPGALEGAAEHGGSTGTSDHAEAAGQQASDHGATAHGASDESAGQFD